MHQTAAIARASHVQIFAALCVAEAGNKSESGVKRRNKKNKKKQKKKKKARDGRPGVLGMFRVGE